MAQNPPTTWETWDLWVGKVPWRRAWQHSPGFLLGESPWTEESGMLDSWGHEDLDTTEQLGRAQ